MPTLADIADLRAGINVRAQREGEGIGVLTMASLSGVHTSGCEDSFLLQAVPEDKLYDPSLHARSLDILIPAKTTPSYLKPILLQDRFSPSRPFNASLIRVRCDLQTTDPWWLFGFLSSSNTIQQILHSSQSATAQLNVSVKTLSTLTLEIPPLHEQQKKGELLRIAHEVRQSARDAADLRYQIASQIAFP